MIHVLLLTLLAIAADHHVATDGSDQGDGSIGQPLASLELAISRASPGDRVIVCAGLYRTRLSVSKSGEPGRPITILGEPGTILDGGETCSGWSKAAAMGDGVYQSTSLPYEARCVSWQNQTIINLGGGYTYTPALAREILRKPPTDAYWTGVEAHYVVLDNVHYLRLRSGEPPQSDQFAFAPAGSAVLRLDHCHDVVVRGFRIRNGYFGIALSGANDCVVEQNFVSNMGKAGVLIEDGGSRNQVRDNEITQNYVYADFGHPWRAPLHHHIWTVWKDLSYGDRMGIRLEGHGDDNDIAHNHVFRCFDGIVAKKGGRHTCIHHNVLENIADDGLCADGTEIESEWHDNLVIEGGNACLCVDGYPHTKGPIFIYRNRVGHSQRDNWGDGIHFKNAFPEDVHVYVYHNSIAASGPSISANDWTAPGSSLPGVRGAKHLYFFNNIYSSTQFFDGWPDWPEIGIGWHAANWVGGSRATEWRGKEFFADSNVIASEQRLFTAGEMDFFPGKAVRGRALDLSKVLRLFGQQVPVLPGMREHAARDLGAVASGIDPRPKRPEQLTVVSGESHVELRWVDRSADETAFLVERSGDGKVFTTVARTAANTTSWRDQDAQPNTARTRWYRVRAANFDTVWLSSFTNEVKIELK